MYCARIILHLLLVILIALPFCVSADSYRCGRKIVKTGDAVGTLLKKCGEPKYKDRGKERIRVNGNYRDTRVERWYYQKSKRRIQRIVIVYQGRVEAIRMGDR